MTYRLTIYPDFDDCRESFETFKFETKDEMIAAEFTSSKLLIFIQDQLELMPDRSNLFVSEELINGKWEEMP